MRNMVATLPIILLIPALLLPFMSTFASGPTLSVSPKHPVAGKILKVKGVGFAPGVTMVVRWDARPMVRVTTNKNGKFWATFRVRADQKKGLHFMKVTTVGTTRDALARLRVFIGKQKPATKPKPPVVDPPGAAPTDGAKAKATPKPTAKPTAQADRQAEAHGRADGQAAGLAAQRSERSRRRPLQRQHRQVVADVRYRLDRI